MSIDLECACFADWAEPEHWQKAFLELKEGYQPFLKCLHLLWLRGTHTHTVATRHPFDPFRSTMDVAWNFCTRSERHIAFEFTANNASHRIHSAFNKLRD